MVLLNNHGCAILWSGIGMVVFGSSIRLLQQQGKRQNDTIADEVENTRRFKWFGASCRQ